MPSDGHVLASQAILLWHLISIGKKERQDCLIIKLKKGRGEGGGKQGKEGGGKETCEQSRVRAKKKKHNLKERRGKGEEGRTLAFIIVGGVNDHPEMSRAGVKMSKRKFTLLLQAGQEAEPLWGAPFPSTFLPPFYPQKFFFPPISPQGDSGFFFPPILSAVLVSNTRQINKIIAAPPKVTFETRAFAGRF